MAGRVTAERLRWVLEAGDAKSIADVCRALGVKPAGGNYAVVRDVASEAGLTLPEPANRGRLPRPEEPQLPALVAGARSHSEVLRALGREPSGRDWRRYKASLAHLNLESSHLGRGWQQGGSRPPTREETERYAARAEVGDVGRTGLGPRLIRYGLLAAACSRCERTQWEGVPIPLELDHIDGDRTNNRLDNLRLLCPNCHALTPTYRGRNMRKRAYANWQSGLA